MTSTLRVTTALKDGAARLDSPLPTPRGGSFQTELPKTTAPAKGCQERQSAHDNLSSPTRKGKRKANPSRRPTFNELLLKALPVNVCRLKNRAFAANQVAKVTFGTSRQSCYERKSMAMNTLLKYGVAFLCTFEVSDHDALIGIEFAGGGKLHTKPASLDPEARNVLCAQLIAAINSAATDVEAPWRWRSGVAIESRVGPQS